MRSVWVPAILGALAFASSARAELLDIPLQPSTAICRAVAKNNAEHVSVLSRSHSACLQTPGDGGGSVCSKASCLRLHIAMNEATRAMSQINATCLERARQSEKVLLDEQAERQRLAEASTWLDQAKRIESSADEFLSLNDMIERPLERLAKLVNESLDGLKRRIGAMIRTNNGAYSDPNAALLDELFARAGQANRSLSNSPFRAFVTQASLDSVYFGQSALFGQWREIEEQMRNGFDIAAAPNPRFAPAKPPPNPTADRLDCSILADTERSRQLSMANPAAWLQLVTTCEK